MTYGAPTNLDLSACIVSTDGGKTNQTLAAMGQSVANNATAIVQAQKDVTDAKTAAVQASEDAADAKAAVNEALTEANVNVASGVAQINADGSLCVPAISDGNASAAFGNSSAPIKSGGAGTVSFTGAKGTATDYFTWNNPDGTSNFGRYLDGNVLTGRSSGSLNLGLAAQPINTVYAKNATVVTSDATTKTITAKLCDSSYLDGQKLIAALANVKPTVYQLNSSIEEKGAATARYHVGYIAQDVEAAIAAAGLDPAKFALWTKTALFTVTQNKDTSFTQIPDVDAKGNQKYIQMLRYEEIFPVVAAGLAGSIVSLTVRVSTLEAKVSATAEGTV